VLNNINRIKMISLLYEKVFTFAVKRSTTIVAILGLIKILRIKFTIFGLRKKGNIAPHVIAMMVFRANDGVV
jgi:hypothetical protein